MSIFRVVWAVQVEADSCESAVAAARDMQLDTSTLATLFNVAEVDSDGIGPMRVIDVDTFEQPMVH